MQEKFFKEIAAQLRKPYGEVGNEVAEKMNEGNREMNLGTIEMLDVSEGDRILEIGMGNGFFVKDILNAAANVAYIGCDYSEDMVRLASELNGDFVKGGQAEFIHCSADGIPIPDHSVDKLFTVNTLYFWEDQGQTMAEFYKVLKPGGLLLITIRPGRVMHKYPTTKYNFNFFEKEDLEKLLSSNNFDVFEVREVVEENMTEIFDETFASEYLIVAGKAK